ncbi:MAG: molybdate ABC transporter permease subunit [Dermabacter sp.]|nr:molybdate ABC transporter permease subunit [Dermabacter sp.]
MRQRRWAGSSLPLAVLLLGLIAGAIIVFPLLALASHTSWGQLWEIATEPSNLSALRLSVLTASLACLVATVTGTALALALARSHGTVAALVRAVVLVPLVLPPVVSGLALLFAYGRAGPLAPLLRALDLQIVFSTPAVILAQVFVSLPFVVVTLEGAVRQRGLGPERAAASLGAGRSRVLCTVTLPRFAPLIGLAATLAFARSLGEFGATLMVAGSLEGTTRTVPLQIYLVRETDMAAAVSLAMVLVVFSLLVVILAYARGPLGKSAT